MQWFFYIFIAYYDVCVYEGMSQLFIVLYGLILYGFGVCLIVCVCIIVILMFIIG